MFINNLKNLNLQDTKVDIKPTNKVQNNQDKNNVDKSEEKDFDEYLSDVDKDTNVDKNNKTENEKVDNIDKDSETKKEDSDEILNNSIIQGLIFLLQNVEKNSNLNDIIMNIDKLKQIDLSSIENLFVDSDKFEFLKEIISDIRNSESIDLSSLDMDILEKVENLELKDMQKLDNILQELAKIDKKEYNINVNLSNDDYEGLENSASMFRSNIFETKKDDTELSTLESFLDVNYNSQVQNITKNDANSDVEVVKAPTVINQQTINDDVIQTIRYVRANGIEEIKVKISPRELGDMVIKLTKDTELNSKVVIELTNKDAYELVNRNLAEITKHLSDSNIDIKDVVVTINADDKNLENDNFGSEFERHNQENKKNKKIHIDENDFLNTHEELLSDDTLNILA